MNKERNILQLINIYRSAIMGFAALWILIHHEWLPLTPEGTVLFRLENYICDTGFIGVDIFLLISGMGLYYAIQKHDIKTFYKRRFIRILPALLIMAVIMALIDGWSLQQFICNITGINFYKRNTFLFLWYGIAIIQIYLVFPLYYKLFSKAKNKKSFTLLAILIWTIFVLVFVDLERIDLLTFTNRIPIFLIGVLFGWMERNEKVQLNKCDWILCFIVFTIGLFLEFLLSGSWGMLHAIGTGLPAVIECIPLVLILAKLFELIITYLKRFSDVITKLFTLIGAVSFELYCVQEWIGNKIQQKMIGNYSNLTINIVKFFIIFLCCVMLYLLSRFIKSIVGRINKNYVKTLE